jgi:hypothetical protein
MHPARITDHKQNDITTMLKTPVALSFILLLFSCGQNETGTVALNESGQEESSLANEELIKRGKYLTTISGCNDCHSPKVMTAHGPEPDTTRLLSGHPAKEPIGAIVPTQDWILFNNQITAFVGPWGISFGANLTPHETGIGNWSFEQFKTAITKGKYKGLETGRPLLPPMPWQMYRHMTEQDLEAVFAYLKSLPPIDNLVPSHQTPVQLSQVASTAN